MGRNPIYIGGLFLFVLFQVPILFAKNIETILVFRLLAGFVGSPALATGGASMGDIYSHEYLPYAVGAWSRESLVISRRPLLNLGLSYSRRCMWSYFRSWCV